MAEKVNTEIPPSVHRGLIEKFRFWKDEDGFNHRDEHQAFDLLEEALDFTRDTYDRVLTAHHAIMANKLETRLRNLQRSEKVSHEGQQRIGKTVDRNRAKALKEIGELEMSIRGPKPVDHATAGEIRAYLATLDDKARMKIVCAAVKEGDDAMAAAILHAPSPRTTGMSKVQVEAVRANWQRVNCKHKADLLDRLNRALTQFDAATSLASNNLIGLTPAKEIEAAERAEAAAREASERVIA